MLFARLFLDKYEFIHCSLRPRLCIVKPLKLVVLIRCVCFRSAPTITYDENDVPVVSNVYVHAQTLNERMICYERQLPSLVCEYWFYSTVVCYSLWLAVFIRILC